MKQTIELAWELERLDNGPRTDKKSSSSGRITKSSLYNRVGNKDTKITHKDKSDVKTQRTGPFVQFFHMVNSNHLDANTRSNISGKPLRTRRDLRNIPSLDPNHLMVLPVTRLAKRTRVNNLDPDKGKKGGSETPLHTSLHAWWRSQMWLPLLTQPKGATMVVMRALFHPF